MGEVRVGGACLWMALGVGGDVDVEAPGRLLADEAHEVGGEGELTVRAQPRWGVAAQYDQPAHAGVAAGVELAPHVLPARPERRQVRHGGDACRPQAVQRDLRSAARAASRTIGHRHEVRTQCVQGSDRLLQARQARNRLARKDLGTELRDRTRHDTTAKEVMERC